jgi:hypothetical protein
MINIVLPVSRIEFLDRVFENLNALECDASQVNLLSVCDGDQRLFEKIRNLTVASKFNEKLCVFRNKGPANTSSMSRRRQRIADIHNEVKGLIYSCEYIFLIEDDTLLPSNALSTLLENYKEHPEAGFISGVQIGRWGFTLIGGYTVDNYQSPNKVLSIPNGEGLQAVDAAGIYCCLTKKEHYISHIFTPFENVLGPDFDWGIHLRQRGLQNYINHDIKCGHLTKKGEINFENTEVMELMITRDDSKYGWRTAVVDNLAN